jgi:hypothetical protein
MDLEMGGSASNDYWCQYTYKRRAPTSVPARNADVDDCTVLCLIFYSL